MRRFLRVALLALPLLAATLCLAQTTGDIVGRVTDEQGGALPGATVEARSPSFQGVRTNVTDATGTFRLILLPPGVYKVTASLPGFTRVEQSVTVALGKTATSDLSLRAAVKEEVSSRPRRRSWTELERPGDQHRQPADPVPSHRPPSSIVQISPGVSTQTTATAAFSNAITVYGSTGLEGTPS
jgi:hypothetical protein